MSLNSTPTSERIHIGFFGRRNAGKSSLVNAVTGQNLSIVSDTKGTTTDPVTKSMELLPLGAVTIIDTAGLDDEGELGSLRIEKTKQILRKVNIAILVIDATEGIKKEDKDLISDFQNNKIRYITVYNKSDLLKQIPQAKDNEIYTSATNNNNIYELKELIANIYKKETKEIFIVKDFVRKNDNVILVTPIDNSAPKGRLILPQQQVIRELLEAKAITTIVQETELISAINSLATKPKLVITDSQVFGKVNKELKTDIPLTSFSILFAKYKGVLDFAVQGVTKLEKLKNNDTILISEGCTHHRQCNDIGSVKLPNWIKEYTKKNLNFEYSSGNSFPNDLSKYAMIIHCGGCMLNDKEVLYRYKSATEQNIPISNYGITIAYIHKILKRSIEIFPNLHNLI